MLLSILQSRHKSYINVGEEVYGQNKTRHGNGTRRDTWNYEETRLHGENLRVTIRMWATCLEIQYTYELTRFGFSNFTCYSGFLCLISNHCTLLLVNLYLWENCADERNSSEEISRNCGIPDTWREMSFTHVSTYELFHDNLCNCLRGNGNVNYPVAETCYRFERSYQV